MPVRGLRLLNQIPVNLQENPVSSHILQLLCSLETCLLTAATANNNMPQKLVPPSRGLRIGNRYCGSLDGVLYV